MINSSPITTWEGAGAIFTFAGGGAVFWFWVMAVLLIVPLVVALRAEKKAEENVRAARIHYTKSKQFLDEMLIRLTLGIFEGSEERRFIGKITSV